MFCAHSLLKTALNGLKNGFTVFAQTWLYIIHTHAHIATMSAAFKRDWRVGQWGGRCLKPVDEAIDSLCVVLGFFVVIESTRRFWGCLGCFPELHTHSVLTQPSSAPCSPETTARKKKKHPDEKSAAALSGTLHQNKNNSFIHRLSAHKPPREM